MPDWRKILTRTAAELERQAESRRIHAGAGAGVPVVTPYRSFGTRGRLHVTGRVLRERRVTGSQDAESVWMNLAESYRRFRSDEVPGALLRLHHGGRSFDAAADDEGYFHVELDGAYDSDELWHRVDVELVQPPSERPAAVAEVLVPPQHAEFGIVSDLDDTVIRTGATSLVTMIRTVALNSVRTRLPFPGVTEFYDALQRGARGEPVNPIFYVSSGPWNLYDLYADFLDLQQIPRGPIFLSDYGIDDTKLIHLPHEDHKLARIRLLLDTYPSLRFVLIGDSGQRDPEIYLQLIEAAPERFIVAYIRDVTETQRDTEVQAIAARAVERGVPMHLVGETSEAAADALERGLVRRDAANAVAASSAPPDEAV